jgi:hypothetical protein
LSEGKLFPETEFKGTPWENGEIYLKHSPIRYANIFSPGPFSFRFSSCLPPTVTDCTVHIFGKEQKTSSRKQIISAGEKKNAAYQQIFSHEQQKTSPREQIDTDREKKTSAGEQKVSPD